MKKTIVLILLTLVAVSLVCLCGCTKENAVLDETKAYQVQTQISSLNIQLNAADFKIENGDAFLVESNLKYLSVSEKNGVLTIVDNAKSNSSYTDATLTLYVPSGIIFDSIDIETGAAKMNVDTLSANTIELVLGAGDVQIGMLNASSGANIKGGAGKINVASGIINNLDIEVGAGKLDLTARVLGDSEFEFGVGESNITLVGSKEEYTVDIEKGIGSITVDGSVITGTSSIGNGSNCIDIEGGVGAINLNFQAN